MAPEPLQLGAVTFSMDSPSADYANCALLRFDPQKIPLLRQSVTLHHLNPTDEATITPHLVCNGVPITFDDLAQQFGGECRPASGWVGKVEWREDCGDLI